MKKRIFSLIFCLFIVLGTSVTAFAYDPTGFEVNAKQAMLVSLDTDRVLYKKNETAKVYPASITKIMTVTLMLESDKYDPNAKIAMTQEILKLISGTGSAVSGLKAGEEVTQLDMVYYVLMSSYGDCAYLAAQFYGGSVDSFVEMMNSKAKELKLTGTHYTNPVGLHDDNHYTTPYDTYVLTKYALKNETFKKVCESARYTVPATNMSPQRTLSTTNFLQDNTTNYYYMYAKGVKTGFTDEAGRCLVSTASYNGYNYMCLLFGCTNSKERRYEFIDSKNLYRWAFNNFSFKQAASTQSPVCEIPVNLSFDTDFIKLYVEKDFVAILPKEADESTITVKPDFNGKKSIDAPIKKGQVIATADVIYAEEVIGTVNLIAQENVKKSTLLTIWRSVKSFFSSVYMKIIYILIGLFVLIFIILIIRLNAGRSKKRRVKYIPYNERKENDNENNY